MLIFTTIDKSQIAINPSSIISIEDANEFVGDSKVIKICTLGYKEYLVHYSDFQALVRNLWEYIK